jgi:hypothetical protein
MKFDIDDKVILRFSEERKDSSALFRAADGEFATVVGRYTQSYLPDIDFYEVELETPVSMDRSDVVLVSGLLHDELEPLNPQHEGKINPKYLTKDAKAMKHEIKKHAHKDSKDPSAYTSHPDGGWKADYNKSGKPHKTKMSQHTKRFHQMFGEAFMEQISEGQVETALKTKAEKSGISKTILRKVYDRGLAAWRTGHRPGVTQHQWAMARVNSFATKGKGTWGKADKDLAQKVRKTNETLNWGADNRFTWDQEDQAYIFKKTVEYINIDVYNPPKNLPESITALINQKYPDFERLTELGLHKGIEFENMRPESCELTYYMKPVMGRYGIDEIETVAIKLRMLFSLEVFNVDKDDYETWDELNLEMFDDTNLFMKGRVKYEIGKAMPLEFESIEINMHQSWKHQDFSYEIRFGE